MLHDAMDRLSDMLSKVKSREPISSEERMIAAIEAMRRGEAVDVKKSEEPAAAQDESQQEISLEDITSIEFEEDEELDLSADDSESFSFEITEEQLAEDAAAEEAEAEAEEADPAEETEA